MSTYLDKKYINLASPHLERFKWKKDNLANCRCPFCGDSTTSEKKARGYFFIAENTYFFKCHNCGASFNIYKFLEVIAPALFREYCLERFKDSQEEKEIKPKITTQSLFSSAPSYDLLSDLPKDHEARLFVERRKIPYEAAKMGFTELFGQFAKSFNSDYNLLNDKRIIIPIYDEHNQMIGVQGRALGAAKPKYITLKRNENVKLIYGIDKIDKSKPIFIVEGPIDSLFVPNCLACLGSGNFLEIRDKFPNQDLTFVLDNEPRNRNVVDILGKLIERNEKVCIFPSHVKEKDINDMVLNRHDVHGILQTSIYSGPAAMLAYNNWRKC